MNRKRSALAAFVMAAAVVALLAAAFVINGLPGRGAVVDALGPIAKISGGGAGATTAVEAPVPGDNGAAFLPVPAPLDDARVVDAMGPLARLSCHRDDPAEPDSADTQSDALDAPLASLTEPRQGTDSPLLVAALAPLTSLPASQSQRVAEAAQARDDAPVDCPVLLREQFKRLQTGEPQSLCQFRGKVLLVVNTASYCGYTGQYEGLEALYRRYKGRGLVVIGFPSNDFGGQEPGSNQEIAQFCRLTYGVQFPMFEKSSVTTVSSNPLFAALSASTGVTPQWNFYKYLVDRQGRAIAGFDSGTTPSDPKLVQAIERLLTERPPEG